MEHTVDLRLTDAGIVYLGLTPGLLPEDVQELVGRLRDIRGGIAFIASAVAQEVERRGGEMVMPSSIMDDSALAACDSLRELVDLEKVWWAAAKCHQIGLNEPNWNDRVHRYALLHDLKPSHGVDVYNV